jgi:hypothetical protein
MRQLCHTSEVSNKLSMPSRSWPGCGGRQKKEALHHSKSFSDTYLRIQELPEEQAKELSQQVDKAQKEIDKAVNIGSLFFCDEAIACLKQYTKEAHEAAEMDSWSVFLSDDNAASNKCLKALIPIAKRDLRAK